MLLSWRDIFLFPISAGWIFSTHFPVGCWLRAAIFVLLQVSSCISGIKTKPRVRLAFLELSNGFIAFPRINDFRIWAAKLRWVTSIQGQNLLFGGLFFPQELWESHSHLSIKRISRRGQMKVWGVSSLISVKNKPGWFGVCESKISLSWISDLFYLSP